jgi:hypothetical protein
MLSQRDKDEELQEWERELFAPHRWGRMRAWFPESPELWDAQRASQEHTRLKELWEKTQPLSESSKETLKSIISLEICNWNLEESVLSLCRAIGKNQAPRLRIGHADSITDDRWRKVWAYYLALKAWLPSSGRLTGYNALLDFCDPESEIRNHVLSMLGESSELKRLYVERFCLNLEYWIGGFYPQGSPQMKAYSAAAEKLEEEILKLDPDPEMLEWMRLNGKRGWIEICHHKAFRRFDIHISSIGSGKWRGAIPYEGTEGRERAETLEKLLTPIEEWIKGPITSQKPTDDGISKSILKSLGKRNNSKLFLAALLVSLLRSQQIAARNRAEKRARPVN